MILLFLFSTPAWSRDYQVRYWQVGNGLPDNTITALAQTPDGYLWIGTRKGLTRFDGDSFRLVDASNGITPEDTSVIGLQTDTNGVLWVLSQSGLVRRYREGMFELEHQPDHIGYVNGPIEHLGIQSWRDWKSVLTRDGHGDIWALADHGQVFRFTPAGAVTPVNVDPLPPGNVRGLAGDAAGRVWLLKGTNVCVFTDGQWAFSTNVSVPLLSQLLCPAGTNGFYISETSNTVALVETWNYQADTGWKISPESVPTTPAHPPTMAMLTEPDGQLWLGERWGGICFQPPGGDWTRLQATGPAGRGSASCMFKDRQNNLWVGTFEEGLVKVYEPSVKVVMLPPEDIDANLHVTTVCAAHDGGFWSGTDSGLYHGFYDGASLINPLRELRGESVYSVLEDSSTNLWVGTASGLFYRSTNGFQQVYTLPPHNGGLLALYEARDRSIWAAGPHGVILSCGNSTNEPAVEPVSCNNSNARLCCLSEDPQGRIWVGSGGSGIFRVKGKKLVRDGPPANLLGTNVRAIHFDDEGVLWIGTWENGLFSWAHKKIKHFNTEDGLADDVILGLATDSLTNLWMITHDGIVGVSRRQLASYSPGKSPPLLCQHLQLDEDLRICSGAGQPVISTLQNGWFWTATMLGVTGYNPKILAASRLETEPRIESLKADALLVLPSHNNISVSADTRRFEFQYSVPELDTPESLRFRYRLDHLDPTWIDAGSARSAVYSQLPPGHYRFRVMVGGTDGVWREIKPPIDLMVVPHIWQTVWFRVLAIVSVIALLAGMGIWNERRKIHRRMERLEARQTVERMRQRIARDLHDELGSGITGIIQHGDMMLRVEPEPAHLRSTIGEMSGRLRQLSVALDEIVWTMNSRNDTLPNLVGYITNHAQEFLRPTGIRCRLDVARNLPALPVDSQTRHNLFLAVKEALHNAAKHSGATEVMVRIHFQEDCLRVSIEDNGRGFDPAAITPGDGLANIRERLQAIQGQAEFFGGLGHGTKVVLELPLNCVPVPG